ncbi:uncharacterized protein LOC134265981 [Saccostrea cucullata]|uniref:uncharacterized protein LOC134265981 n=1 Tax=Saccostrea cuccullata TaxID=36930 RepID=UPI002ED0FB35
MRINYEKMRHMSYACNNHLVETVTDDKLTVSSIFDKDYLPQYARLSHTFGWSPNEKESNPWIQVDFGRKVAIKAIKTKGLGHVPFEEWVKKYVVRYSDTTSAWKTISNWLQISCHKMFEARFLRLYPTSCNKYCSLRFEVVGCEVKTTTKVHTTRKLSTPLLTTTTSAATPPLPPPHSTASTSSTAYITTKDTCPCVCLGTKNSTLTTTDLEAKIISIIQNLTLPRNITSSYLRSKISVYDTRPEMVFVGSVGIAFLCFIAALIVLPDSYRCFVLLHRQSRKITSRL